MAGARYQKEDPISDRTRALTEEIAALESQIRELGSRLQSGKSTQSHQGPVSHEPVFEPVSSGRLPRTAQPIKKATKSAPAAASPPGLWKRFTRSLRPAESANPRLINYLAAGSIQGLRPLRYEKRVARNRVLALSLILLFVIWGLIAVLNR